MSHSKMKTVDEMKTVTKVDEHAPAVDPKESVENKPVNNTPAPTTKKVKATDSATTRSDEVSGAYHATVDLNMRHGAGMHKKVMVVIPANTKVRNYGYYTVSSGITWLYVQTLIDGTIYSGFCSSEYLSKI